MIKFFNNEEKLSTYLSAFNLVVLVVLNFVSRVVKLFEEIVSEEAKMFHKFPFSLHLFQEILSIHLCHRFRVQ